MNTNTMLSKWSWMQLKRILAVRAGVVLLCLAAATSPAQTYTVLHNFIGGDGAQPVGGLLLSGTTLYGTTVYGRNYGTVFKMNTDGSGFAVLKYFTGSDGAYPYGGLVLSGTRLYGVTSQGGGHGTVFKMNTDGSGFAVLKYFAGSDGAYPNGGLVFSGTTLYGTTAQGGISDSSMPAGYGTVFKLNTDGGGYTVLKHFNNSDGELPFDHLVLSGKTLYGTTDWDGYACSIPGTIFKLNTDGSGFTVLKRFVLAGEHYPGGLLLSGTTLYGATEFGGVGDNGTLYQMNTDGSGYALLKQFSGGDGAWPHGDLVLSGTTLYGTTQIGGSFNAGVVFSLSLPLVFPTIVRPPRSQTAEAGSTPQFTVDAKGFPPPGYQWYFDATNAIGSTDSCLELTNVQFSQSGAYTAAITNAAGAITSSPAMLNVIAVVERRPVPGVKMTGDAASFLNVDYANTLSPAPDWTTLGSVSLTSTSQYYFDLTLPLPPQRFYRAWQTGTPGLRPSLDLHLVPAITLTGNLGDSVRLDYINQFGPIDAWLTLATVTLTNTSQLYFDVSAPMQPARLYRLVPSP